MTSAGVVIGFFGGGTGGGLAGIPTGPGELVIIPESAVGGAAAGGLTGRAIGHGMGSAEGSLINAMPGKGKSCSKGSGKGKPDQNMFGAKGTQLPSKTIWNRGSMRIDVENFDPGFQKSNLHFQDQATGGKYLYNPETGLFEGAPSSVNEMLDDPSVQKAIQKGLRYLIVQ